MRRLLFALPFALLAAPALAQPAGMDPMIDKLLACATIFSIQSEDLYANGDAGGSMEMSNRSNELGDRAVGLLSAAGTADADIENIVMNHIMVTSFEFGAEFSRYTTEECLALVG